MLPSSKMNPSLQRSLHSLRRIFTALFLIAAILGVTYLTWQPGSTVTDGRHDRGTNGIWISHGWLGDNNWFTSNNKTDQFGRYRDESSVQALAAKLRRHGITDVFPHVCPSDADGNLPAIDHTQTEKFLDVFTGFRVMPWIGGPNETKALPEFPQWRANFTSQVAKLLNSHPRFAGIHLNIEPLTSGDPGFLKLLEELRAVLPPGRILSIAAYPPPTFWQPGTEVHWEETYFREVAKRSDQMAVMMYDVGQRLPKTYVKLMADWTEEVLQWSDGKPVLLGLPTYDDAGVGYHDPKVENLETALSGIHAALKRQPVPKNYQGVAIYCEWETTEEEWELLRKQFLKSGM